MKQKKKRRSPSAKERTGHSRIEYLFGVNPVTEALRAKRRKIQEILIVDGKSPERFSDIISMAQARNIAIRKVDFKEMCKLAGTDAHQSVAAKTEPFRLSDLSEITKTNGLVVLLDGIEDPQNLGAIARTALCAGAAGIIIPKDRSVSPAPSASKASAGAMEHLKIAMVTNLSTAIKELKKSGYWITGLDTDADYSLYDADLSVQLAVVIGGEDRGLRNLVRQNCDFIISIPQKQEFNSLNASVAAAVVIYEAVRQRGAS